MARITVGMRSRTSFIHHTVGDSLRPGAQAAVTRAFYRAGSAYCAHDHEFPEVFWIEDGTALHVMGRREEREELPAGTVVFVRPDDVHAFETLPGVDFTLVNVVLRPEAVARVAAAYAEAVAEWPWPEPARQPRPVHRRLDRRGLDAAQAWADAIVRSPDRLAVDGLLLTLLQRTAAPAAADDVPPWLRQAVIAFGSPEHLAEGVPGFARLAGRGMAHLNRSVRRHYGSTATELVNRLRLEHASRRLGMSEDAILDIALECGFDSLSYFYRVFRRAYGETPHRYRARNRSTPRVGWS